MNVAHVPGETATLSRLRHQEQLTCLKVPTIRCFSLPRVASACSFGPHSDSTSYSLATARIEKGQASCRTSCLCNEQNG